MKNLMELYRYREMLKNLVRKDLRTRYKGSFFGFLWTFINPLLQLLVYTAIFSTIMRVNIDKYHMFLFVALLPWIFFSNSILLSTNAIVGNKDLIKKVYFPRIVLPISVVTSGLINLLYGFIIVILALLITGVGITAAIIYLPVVTIVAFVMTLGFSLLFSSLNVFFRDLEHILGIVTMAWFYFTPVLFSVDMIPPSFMKVFFLNPMTPIILSFRDVLYYGQAPDWRMLGISLLIGLLLVLFGSQVFHMLEKNFAEEI